MSLGISCHASQFQHKHGCFQGVVAKMEANAAVSNPAKQPLLILRSPPVVGPETTWKQARRMDALLRRTPQTLSLHGPHGLRVSSNERQPATRPNFL